MPDKELTRAGFGPRAAAYIFDRALLLIPLGILRMPFLVADLFGASAFSSKDVLFDHSALDVLCWLGVCAYFVLMTWSGGWTLGKRIMHLRVCRADGGELRFIDILYRETVGRFLSGILCLGYLMTLADKENRAFHDWLCGTCVVYDGVRIPRVETAPSEPFDGGWSVPGDGAPALPETEAPSDVWSLPSREPAAPAAEPEPMDYSVPGWVAPLTGSAPAGMEEEADEYEDE